MNKLLAGAALATVIALPAVAAPVYSVSVYTGDPIADGLDRQYNSSGDYGTATPGGQAAWYDASTDTTTPIGSLGGGYAYSYGISDNGKVTGWGYLPGNSSNIGFVWNGSGPLEVLTDTLGGSYSGGYAINDSGQVAGYSYVSGNGAYHAVLWDDGAITDLGTLGGNNSHAWDINNAGQVVGESLIAGNSAFHAFLWEDGVLQDLNDLLDASGDGWLLWYANGINHEGLIYGWGFDPQGIWKNYLLTPVAVVDPTDPSGPGTSIPEPTALALFGLGIAGLGLVRRRHMA